MSGDEAQFGRTVALHDQAVSSLAQIGRIVAPAEGDPEPPDTGTPHVLVHIGAEKNGTFTRTWMPWLVRRAGQDAEWWMPDEGEQVVVLAPSGNLSHGIVIGSIYRGDRLNYAELDDLKKKPEPPHQLPDGKTAGPLEGLHKTSHVTVYRDGTTVSYDREAHKLDVVIKSDPKKEALFALSAALSAAEGKTGDASFSVRVGDAQSPAATLSLNVSDNKGEIEISASEAISIAVGDTRCAIAKEAITLTSKTIKLEADGTTLTVDSGGVDVS